MQVTPTSHMAKAIAAARSLIINSPTFQSRCKFHEDCPDPSHHVYLYDSYRRNKRIKDMRPCVVVGLDEMDYSQIMPGCSQVNLTTRGGVMIVVLDDARHANFESTNAPDDSDDSYLDFLNYFGGILDDQDGRLANHAYDGEIGFPFRGIDVVEEPMRVPYTDRAADDYWGAIAVFRWGDE